MSYVYIKSEPNLWTVGFYDPNSNWNPKSIFSNKEEAAKRVRWLNGENEKETIDVEKDLEEK